MGKSNQLGKWGEALAAEYLRKKRYAVLASGFRCRFGEIDLIASSREYLVFVEVKLRKNSEFAQAREFVDWKKQNRIRTTAAMYLSLHPSEKKTRFDVVEIYAPEGMETARPVINHLEDAFE